MKNQTKLPQWKTLLKSLELKGCLVTIDAMGCQKNIAEVVIEQKADYIDAVKDNQPTLHQAIQDYLDFYISQNLNIITLKQFKICIIFTTKMITY